MYKSFHKNLKQQNPELPERHGESWSDKETKRVLELVQKKISIEDIAGELKRTNGSITGRLKHIALDMYNSGISIENITLLTSLRIDEINETIKKEVEKEIEKKRKKEELAQVPVADIMEIKVILYEMRDLLRKIASKGV